MHTRLGSRVGSSRPAPCLRGLGRLAFCLSNGVWAVMLTRPEVFLEHSGKTPIRKRRAIM